MRPARVSLYVVVIALAASAMANVPVITPRPAGDNRPIKRSPLPTVDSITLTVPAGPLHFPLEVPLALPSR